MCIYIYIYIYTQYNTVIQNLYFNILGYNSSYTFRPNCTAIFRLIFEYDTPPTQRPAWRWPYNFDETCSWSYNLI